MHKGRAHRHRHAVVIVASLLLAAQFGAQSLRAQSSEPPAATGTPGPTPVSPAETETQPGFVIRAPDASATPLEPTATTVADERAAAAPTAESFADAFGAKTTQHAFGAGQQTGAAAVAVMSADAEVAPAALHAGDALTYTFSYTNVSGSTQNNVIALVTWTRMQTNESTAEWERTQMQFCAGTCAPLNVTGPSVTKGPADANGNNVQYQIASLAPGQSGQFSVALKIRRNQYPRTGSAPSRPAASIQMFADGNLNTKLAEDTANTLIIGPVIALNKVVAPSTVKRVTINEPMAFQIGIGNTTAAGDIIDNRPRADAEAASNLVFTDQFPVGADYIASNDDPPGVTRNVDTVNRVISWTVSSLAPRETVTVTARFKKNLDPIGCDAIANTAYQATASEYPLNYSGARYKEPEYPLRVAVDVVPLIKVADMTMADANITFGDETTATLVVHNYHTQTVTGAQLEFTPHNKIAYVPGSASPAPSTAPLTPTFGGQVLWNFTIGAGSSLTPTVMTFTFRVRAGFAESLYDQAQMRIIAPPGLNSACMGTLNKYVSVSPRLQIAITRSPWYQPYQIESTRPYTYEIEVRNRSRGAALYGATVTATLPANASFPANFSYIPNSATIDGVPLEPNQIQAGNGGAITWRNAVTIPANASVKIAFSVLPAGYEFVEYCTSAVAGSSLDPETRPFLNVCLKINPPIDMSKQPEQYYVADPATESGREVTFSLRITNTGQLSYSIALLDLTRGSWTFVRQVEGNNGAPTARVNGDVEWPLQLVPPGQSLYARVVLRVPQGCPLGEYTNELGFRFTAADNSVYDVVRSPALAVKVPCITELEIGKSSDRATIGLFDQVIYTIYLTNKSSGQAINTAVITDILPIGFTYESQDSSTSPGIGAPVFSTYNDRQVIAWPVSNIAATQSKRIVFVARSGHVVGQFDNWVWGASPERVAGKCFALYGGQCIDVDMGAGPVRLMAHRLSVEPLATLEPTLSTDACVQPGDALTYTLTMVSTNDRDYSNTTVAITVPLGMRVLAASSSASSGVTTQPVIANDSAGNTVVRWTGVTLPRKPFNQSNAQVEFYVRLKRDNLPGDLTIISSASSPVGGILKKDTTQDPVARACPLATGVYAYKAASLDTLRNGDALIFELGVVNSTTQAVNLTVADTLASIFTYSGTISGAAPQVSGQLLTWPAVTVPAMSGGAAGRWSVRIKVRLGLLTLNRDFSNAADIANPSAAVNSGWAQTTIHYEGVPPTPTPTPTPSPTATMVPVAGTKTATPASPASATPRPFTPTPTSTSTSAPGATVTPALATATPTPTATTAPTINPTVLAAQRHKVFIPLARR